MKNSRNNTHKNKKREKNKPDNPRNKRGNKPNGVKIDLFGTHAVIEAWINPQRHIHTLYITENALNSFDEALKKAHDRGLKRPSPQIIDKSVLDHATPTGSVHQGIGLDVQNLEGTDIHDFIRASEAQNKSVLVMLDQVTDPHNVGAILRSSCAFGASGMIMQSKHAPALTGVLAKTACGAVEHVPVAYETNLTRTLETLQEAGYFAIALDERGEDISQLPDYSKMVLVLGAEGAGLRRLVKEQCDVLTRLPMHDAMPSINVSNAAAVALYALTT